MWELTLDTKILSTSGVNWRQLGKALRNTPLERLAPSFVAAEKTFGVNALMLASMAVLESAWGKSALSKRTKNLFGFRAYDRNPSGAAVFRTYEQCILIVAKYIGDFYATPGAVYYRGGTIKAMGKLWASDPNWAEKVCGVARTLARRSS
ncbi:N-acetylmuramoyl-L-alanine amidase [Coprothermobacteraceae bacterium]|nr:N-acetylmuramoyl-L-alanine amidase [Coprothermobacteraceae bacterium]